MKKDLKVPLLHWNNSKTSLQHLNCAVIQKKTFSGAMQTFIFSFCGCGCWAMFCNLAVNALRVMAHKGGLSSGMRVDMRARDWRHAYQCVPDTCSDRESGSERCKRVTGKHLGDWFGEKLRTAHSEQESSVREVLWARGVFLHSPAYDQRHPVLGITCFWPRCFPCQLLLLRGGRRRWQRTFPEE